MLTRIISGAVGALLLAVVLYFHDTLFLPIAVAAMIAVMLFELLRAVKLEKCLPVLIPAELCGNFRLKTSTPLRSINHFRSRW